MKPAKFIQKLDSGEEVLLAALGDSLTYGWMTEKGYLDYLKQMIIEEHPFSKCRILNRGVPGDTARDGLRRIENDVIRFNPDLVFIQFALNDAYTGFSPSDFQRNLELIIIKLKERTESEMLLLTSVALINPEENRIAKQFYDKIEDSGKKYNLPVIRVDEYWEEKISSGTSHSSLVQADGIHPNEKGYKLMAEAVIRFL